MIGSLRGSIVEKQAGALLIDCGGVGYEVATPMSTFLNLPPVGGEVTLLTHLVVGQDNNQSLYGFRTSLEKQLFRSLLKVSGVGAKMALAILSAMSVGDFSRCVTYGDTASLTRIPGVGKKTAERLVVEMRDRVGAIGDAVAPETGVRPAVDPGPRQEAMDALVALGYKPAEIGKLVDTLDTDGKTAEDIIRGALKRVAEAAG